MYRLIMLVVLVGVLSIGTIPGFALQIDPDPDLTLLWAQVESQPDDFSVACLPLNDPASAVYYNADEAFPLASVSKLMIFIEYARRVESGTLNPLEGVSTVTLNRYDLRRTDGGAHERFMTSYDDGEVITLDEIAIVGMIQYSSNAASDYVLSRLGLVDWNSLYRQLNVTNTGYPHALTRIPLLMNNHETGQASRAVVDALSVAEAQSYFNRYINDDEWRAAELAYRAERRRSFPSWDVQTAILQHYTVTGTTRDFINTLRAIYGTTGGLTPQTRQFLRAGLRWRNNEDINNTYLEYGSKLGFYSGGTLTLVAYGDAFSADPVITAVFLRNVPQGTYNDLRRADSLGDFVHWLNLNGCNGLTEQLPPV